MRFEKMVLKSDFIFATAWYHPYYFCLLCNTSGPDHDGRFHMLNVHHIRNEMLRPCKLEDEIILHTSPDLVEDEQDETRLIQARLVLYSETDHGPCQHRIFRKYGSRWALASEVTEAVNQLEKLIV